MAWKNKFIKYKMPMIWGNDAPSLAKTNIYIFLNRL